ncbi:type 1 glutamine amidotransferase domain-containing protein [Corynebacterium xerosis]|uniref:Type 1 glutamine amidotransferase domain-containing protein n=1 Tax=Corynebacterium xerosis TaxID=1725 RepID=A0ABV3UY92_9CORY|nr:type 1 glutamine amidotransferase domain-containing protein [Corynebacterium xerosis]AYJ32762.1 type 1 glutamine amidotransferase [Corynebacterium xerosis]KKO81089.1 peptidase C56 [Corynebacterium xerosis]SQB94572.1 protease I [Clostridium paraputrificum]HJG58206.1 type 1 glutamine amidotransferase [Corynebacterium xerosis]
MTDSANQNQSTDDQGSGFAKKLDGRRIAVLAGQGVEQVELTDPMRAIRAAGGTPVIVSYSEGSFVAMKGDWEHADSFAVDVDVNEAEVEPFDALVLPGGTLNADAARIEDGVLRFVKAFHETGRPIAAICHAPWILIDAGLASGTKLTSYVSCKADLVNAGADWVDEPLVVDGNIITSRNPGDLDQFCAAIIDAAGSAR